MSDEKIQIGIYKIDLEHEIFSDSDGNLKQLATKIEFDNSTYKEQKLVTTLPSNYKFKLLYSSHSSNPKWKSFLGGVAQNGQSVLRYNAGRAESFVLLVQTDTPNLFAITGGLSGYSAIHEYVEDDFGVDVLSRLIKKEEKILKSVKEKSVIGGILGSTKFFRNNYNLFENDSFGKIYQELQASINKELLVQHFGFSLDELKRNAVCVAKASFKINKSVTLPQLLKIIGGCEFVLNNLDPITINSVTRIIKKKNQNLIQHLEEDLFSQLWQRFENENYFIDFDLCHKNFEDYLTADRYIVRKSTSMKNYFNDSFERLESIDQLFKKIRINSGVPASGDELEKLLRSLKIYSYGDSEDTELTKGWLLHHLFGDVTYNDKKYFLIDNNWFLIEESFLSDLDKNCKKFINDHYDELLNKRWSSSSSENDYNASYVGEAKTLVLDKITPENIEACDILKWDSENIYFCHVKEGFGNTMRALCSQVFIAATRLQNDLSSSKGYIKKIYNELEAKKQSTNPYSKAVGEQTNNLTIEQFTELFDTRRLVFVLCVMDSSSQPRSLRDEIEEFRSSIAKFSLQELVKDMRGIDVEFRICQVTRD